MRKEEFIDLEQMKETFKFIIKIGEVSFFDVDHAVARFLERFEIPIKTFKRVLEDGAKIINLKYHNTPDQYSIISYSTDIKIQIHLRPDRKNPLKLIGAIPTVLDRFKHPYDKGNPKKIFVEKEESVEKIIQELKEESKGGYLAFLYDDDPFFIDFFEDGEMYRTYQEIIVK